MFAERREVQAVNFRLDKLTESATKGAEVSEQAIKDLRLKLAALREGSYSFHDVGETSYVLPQFG